MTWKDGRVAPIHDPNTVGERGATWIPRAFELMYDRATEPIQLLDGG
jgi:hypothetical protein